MGDEAEDQAIDLEVEQVEEEIPEGAPEAEANAEAEDIEVVLEGDAPLFTQSDVNDIVAKRVARLNKKGEGSDEVAEALRLKEEENKLLKLALEQKRETGPPKPDDFDGGEFDPGYIKAKEEHQERLIQEQVNRQVQEALKATQSQQGQAAQAQDLEAETIKHYQRAADLKAKDYEAREDIAIDALGSDAARQIMANFEDSPAILYYLGTNPDQAHSIASLLKRNPVKAVAQIGRLSARLQIKPKSSKAPEPEETLEGAIKPTGQRGPKGATYE